MTDDARDEVHTARFVFTVERRPTYNPNKPKWYSVCRGKSGYLLGERRHASRGAARRHIAILARNHRELDALPTPAERSGGGE